MKSICKVLLGAALVLATGCHKEPPGGSGFPGKWRNIRPGMSKEAVTAMCGTPVRTYTTNDVGQFLGGCPQSC